MRHKFQLKQPYAGSREKKNIIAKLGLQVMIHISILGFTFNMVSDFNNHYFLLESNLAKDNDPNNFNTRTSIKC